MVIGTFLDSPDFVFLTNGSTYGYKEVMDMRPNYNGYLNQKCTSILDEKHTVLDNSTVLYTARSKWVVNYKDGHSSLADPDAILFILKKIDSKWKIIYYVDSYVDKNVPSKTSKELIQVDLMKQFLGTWKCEIAKDTTAFYEGKSYGTGLDCYFKFISKGNVVMEGKQLRGYDKDIDKFIFSGMMKGTDMNFFAGWFISKNKYTYVPYKDISNPEKASWKIEGEFKSPDIIFETSFINNKTAKTTTWTRVK
jgi:hypothetical protein